MSMRMPFAGFLTHAEDVCLPHTSAIPVDGDGFDTLIERGQAAESSS